MKLLTCHIENFGKISNTDYNFNSDITSFCKENGYGKTTLAFFLKAMFYGLESDRANSGFNERRHFSPFSGGLFGGNVTFEADGKIYKVERYFDEKSEPRDTLTIYGDKVIIPYFNETVGEKFFGIDKQSFERTIFISGQEIEISSTSSINTKLNNFIAGSNDDTNLESALSKLENKRKEYKKSKSGNDLITRETARLNQLSEDITNAKEIKRCLADKYTRFDELTKEIAELNEKISAAQSENVVITNWENYDAIVASITTKKDKQRQIESNYPFGIPTREEIEKIENALERDRTLNAQSARKLLTDEDNSNYASLQAKFSKGIPNDSILSEIYEDIKNESKINYDLEKLENENFSEKELILLQKFRFRLPSQNEIDELNKKAEVYQTTEEESRKLPDYVTSTDYVSVEPQKINKAVFLSVVSFFALLVIGGLIITFFILGVGIVLLSLGVIGLLITGFLYLNKKTNGKQNSPIRGVQSENPEKLALKKEAEKICAEIQAFILPYGYTLEHGVSFAVASLINDIKEFQELQLREKSKKAERETKANEKNLLDKKLSTFFTKYDISTGSYIDRLSKLRSEIDTYERLKKRKQSAETDEGKLKNEIAKNKTIIIQFCQKYKFDIEVISEKIKIIATDCGEHNSIVKTIKEEEQKANKFKIEKGLTTRPDNALIDLKLLNEELNKKQDSKNSLYTEIVNDEKEVEKLDDLQREYEESKEKLESYKSNYDLLSKVIASLQQADRNLKDKYIKPVKNKFLYYSDLLEKTLGEKITMNSNFEIRYERNGKERSERHLSSGQRSICALCFRLALIDNMYSEEKPFIILDDPFVNLDEEHIEKAKTLIKKISNNMQIIYFSCHTSRAI